MKMKDNNLDHAEYYTLRASGKFSYMLNVVTPQKIKTSLTYLSSLLMLWTNFYNVV